MDIPWEDLRLFLAVADAGSLSGAARELRLGQPTVSRRLAALEAKLGAPLFSRSTLGATPTALGERVLEPARRMAEWAAEVERALERDDGEPRGVVRITAPPGVAFTFLAPFAAWLSGELPEISLEVLSSIQYLDLARREADLALRFRQSPTRDLVVLATLVDEAAAFATPDYAAKLPRRYGMRDVGFIAWAPPLDRLSPNPELAAAIPEFSPVFASDDFLVQLAAARAGVGAIFLGRARHRFTENGGLEELELPMPRVQTELCLVAAKSALQIPRVRAVAERLAIEMEQARVPARRVRK